MLDLVKYGVVIYGAIIPPVLAASIIYMIKARIKYNEEQLHNYKVLRKILEVINSFNRRIQEGEAAVRLPKVKSLTWKKHPVHSRWKADSPFGVWTITNYDDELYSVYGPAKFMVYSKFSTLEEAQSAVYADIEMQLYSAFEVDGLDRLKELYTESDRIKQELDEYLESQSAEIDAAIQNARDVINRVYGRVVKNG